MSELQQQRHRHDAVGCADQQSFYCSRKIEETSASCLYTPGTSASANFGGCRQKMAGPIDVEDLAKFCNFSEQLRAQKLQQFNNAPQMNCCNYVEQQQMPQQPVYLPMSKVNEPYYHPMTLEEAAFAYCTHSRWMACPSTSYCPLYDVSQQPIQSWQVLPCAQNFCNYYAVEDDMLEEYLCVPHLLLVLLFRILRKIR